MTLTVDDFAAFFEEIHAHAPFPWQAKLLRRVASTGTWPRMLDLPTGSGKTAAIDIAIFHLALEADRREARRAPVRIAFVVDRRLIVDDAHARASRIASKLLDPPGDVSARVAARLRMLAPGDEPLISRALRGGIPREDDWARTPAQPTVLCSTVDQVGSRLLFRGYGVSDSMKPVHAGLLGSDCLILLDEAHIAEPFRQTLDWLRVYREPKWRESKDISPWCVAFLTATPGENREDSFGLDEADRSHPVLAKRLSARKLVHLIARVSSKRANADDPDDDVDGQVADDISNRAESIVEEVSSALRHFENTKVPAPAIGVIVNRVARARAVFDRIMTRFQKQIDEQAFSPPVLMIGTTRPLDREGLGEELAPIKTRIWGANEERSLDRPLIVVATQCLEVGVDVDFDGLITEAAPLDALRQRFGRLNRAGREIVPYGSVIAAKADLSTRHIDPVYGKTIRNAWDRLMKTADNSRKPIVDFGLETFAVRIDSECLTRKENAPILLPAHVDLLSQTSPIPVPDPESAVYLHGPGREPDSITMVWRADVDPEWQEDGDVRRLIAILPPKTSEAVELPIWVVRRWLTGTLRGLSQLADVPADTPDEGTTDLGPRKRGRVFRWAGDDERSRWISAAELQPGDMIILPAEYGGLDQFGWNPLSNEPVVDMGQKAAAPFAATRFAVRVAPGLLGESLRSEALADALANAPTQQSSVLRSAVLSLDLPDAVRADLQALVHSRRSRVVAYTDLHGTDEQGRARGVVFLAPFGLRSGPSGTGGQIPTTEDDTAGLVTGLALSLEEHTANVERAVEDFALAAGLPDEIKADLKLAAHLHDAGKADPRFQSWLRYGDPLGTDPDEPSAVLAKSGRRLPRGARSVSGLPERWRHEALSVRMALSNGALDKANDADLVVWLIGTHHGHGRPLFPHRDPLEKAPNVGPQSLAFDWHGRDWPSLFALLKRRYGVWELARFEAILRLADHYASAAEARKVGSQ